MKARLQREKPCTPLSPLEDPLFSDDQFQFVFRTGRFLHNLQCHSLLGNLVVYGEHLAEGPLAKPSQYLKI